MQQLIGRKQEDKSLRGRKLTLQATTPGGRVISAESALRTLKAGGPEALDRWMERIDTIGRDNGVDPTDVIEASFEPTQLDPKQIYTLRAGTYDIRSQYNTKTPQHEVTLPRDFKLFPVTFSFLEQFKASKLVDKILQHRDNIRNNEAQRLVGWICLINALKLAELINPALEGDMRLRMPSVPVLEAFLSISDLKLNLRPGLLLTANRFFHGSLTEDALEVELDVTKIDPNGYYTYVYRTSKEEPGIWVDRHHNEAESTMNTSVVFEVVPSVS